MNETIEAQFRREFDLPRYRVTRVVTVTKTLTAEGQTLNECREILDDLAVECSESMDDVTPLGEDVVEDTWQL